MDYTVTIEGDEVSELVRKSLEETFELNTRTEDNTLDEISLSNSLLIVHRHYSTAEQHQVLLDQFSDEIVSMNKSVNDDLVEQDGGHGASWLTMDMDVSEEALVRLAEKGAEYVVLLAGLGDPTFDQLIKWVERGRREENTDNIMRRYKEARASVQSK